MAFDNVECDKDITQMAHLVSEFEFQAIHCTAIKHQATNALSRLNTKGANKTPLVDEVPVSALSTESFSTREGPEQKGHDWEDDTVNAKNGFTHFLPEVFTSENLI